MTKKALTLKDMIIEKAEELGWSVDIDDVSTQGQDNVRYAEFSQYSPAGEDFSFIVNFESVEDIPKEVCEYFMSFEPEEHVEMWIEARSNGVSGVPDIKTLVEDADEIDDMILELSDALYEVYNKWDEETENVE